MQERGCCSQFWDTIRNEFQVKKLRFKHYPSDDFYKSIWQKGARSFWWLLYRWCAAGFFIGAVVSSAVEFFTGGKFFIYLTDWGLILCMITTTYGAVLATIWYFNSEKRADPLDQSTSLKVFWGLHWSTLVLALVITIMFWAFLFPEAPAMGGDPFNIMQHACNSVVMLIDHMVIAFPSRLLHTVYPMAIGLVYIVFSLIYYAADGTDPMGNHFIYPILDWGAGPGIAVASAIGALILCVIMAFLMFWLYKLRMFFHKECFNTPSPHVIPK